jgi:hypothetical protein
VGPTRPNAVPLLGPLAEIRLSSFENYKTRELRFWVFKQENHRDKWQIIHTWLLGARHFSDCSDAE